MAADLDGAGGREILAGFGALGLWRWNAGAWTQLSGARPDGLAAGDTDGNGDKGSRRGFRGARPVALERLGLGSDSTVNPDSITAADLDGDGRAELAADFGPLGLWLWNDSTWSLMSSNDPE